MPEGEAQRPRLPFPVVGVGASAGGLEAYTEFLRSCPADSGMAYVFVQHLPPDRESLLVELLARQTQMRVLEVEDKQPVEPDHVYVIRPGRTLTIKDGRLRLGPVLEARGHGRPVDDFFRSLAEEQQQRAVAVVLSGMGSNGTAGAEAVKAVGGVVVAQDPDSAKFNPMPRHVIDANLADFIARPADIPEIIARYAAHPYTAADGPDAGGVTPDARAFADVLAVLRTRTRHDFAGYRRPTLMRRIQRRMSLQQIETMGEYVRALRQNAAEATALADDFLIHVTGFFRDPEAWATLADKVIAPLADERADGDSVRAWVAACATGEEAYTVAMLFAEAGEKRGKQFDVKVFATDMAERALAHARAGVFPGGIESEVTPERLSRFFDADGEQYRVKRELRESVVFAPQNVLQDPPFSRLDLVTCRNLLIYLEPDVQRKVLSLFHFGLRDGGTLMLGTSESAAGADDDFEPVDKRHRLFRRVGPTRPGALDFPLPRGVLAQARESREARMYGRAVAPQPVGQAAARVLLEHFTPAAVVVDRRGDVVYFHGDTGRYLQQPRGEPTRELLALTNDQVRGAVRTALGRVQNDNRAVFVRDGLIDTPQGRRRVEVGVVPLDHRAGQAHVLVTFADHPEPPALPAAQNGTSLATDEDELRRVRDELQGAIEELQTSNEELKATHEEATSINEELQSTNEELETSKEELQSLNEELVTVNAQLQAKMAELEATTGDLLSLLTSTDIPVLFLDRAFRIRRYTAPLRDLIDLIPSDAGRPVADLRRKFADPDLLADAQAVLDRLIPAEREVRSDSGRDYARRVSPYRTADDRIDGVVVAFLDVTERKRAERAVRASEEQFRRAIEDAPIPVVMQSEDGQVLQVSRTWTDLTGYALADVPTAEAWLTRAYGPGADAVRGHMHELFRGARKTVDVEFAIRTRAGDERHWSFSASAPGALADGRRFLVGMAVDVTARKLTEKRQAFLLRLGDALRPLADPVAVEAEATRVLGEHLGVGRAFYAEVEPDEDHVLIRRDYTAAGTASIAGRQRLSSFGPHWPDGYRAGRTLVTPDFRAVGGSAAAAFEAVGVRACVGVPVNKGGRFVGVLIVHSATPRDWTPLEVGLIEETAERTWAAVERAEAGAAVRESEARLRQMAANLPNAAVFVIGPDLRYRLAEGQVLRDVGKTPADFEGKTLAEAVPPDQLPFHLDTYNRLLAGEPFRFERAIGGRQFIHSGVPLRDGSGAVTAALAVSYDITDRVRAEEGLRASEERFRLIVENVADHAIVGLDAAGMVTTWSESAERLFGYSAADIVGRSGGLLRTPEDRAAGAYELELETAVRTGRASDDNWVVRRDGSRFWVDGSTSAAYDPAGALAGFVKVVRDRTEQRAADAEVRESRERLKLAAEAAGVGIWRWEAAADVHLRDAHLNQMLGLPAEETRLPLADFYAHIHPDDRATAEAAFADSVRHGRGLSVEFRVVRPDGTVRWLRDQGDVFDAPGSGRYLTGACVDVTDLKTLEAGLRAARDGLESRVAERTDELAAAVGALESEMARRRDLARRLATAQEDERRRVSRDLHDTVGQTQAGLAMALKAAADAAPPGETADRLARARELADGMGRELHAAAVRLRPTALDDIGLEAAARELAAAWSDRHGVPVEFDASGFGKTRLAPDAETALYRAVQEALTNAARHGRASQVSVTLVRVDGHAAAVVEDDGAGFDPDAVAAGRLGLLGMRERMELVGGTVEIESTPGAGTTVIARVPARPRDGD